MLDCIASRGRGRRRGSEDDYGTTSDEDLPVTLKKKVQKVFIDWLVCAAIC